jgi:hypothetical protein
MSAALRHRACRALRAVFKCHTRGEHDRVYVFPIEALETVERDYRDDERGASVHGSDADTDPLAGADDRLQVERCPLSADGVAPFWEIKAVRGH